MTISIGVLDVPSEGAEGDTIDVHASATHDGERGQTIPIRLKVVYFAGGNKYTIFDEWENIGVYQSINAYPSFTKPSGDVDVQAIAYGWNYDTEDWYPADSKVKTVTGVAGNLEIYGIDADKDEVKAGESVKIYIMVQNTGGAELTGTLKLYDDVSKNISVTVDPNDIKTVTVKATAPSSVPSDGSLDVCTEMV